MNREKLLEDLSKGVIQGDPTFAKNAASEAMEKKIDPLQAINHGLNFGMKEVGKRFSNGEFFLPELILATKAMEAALEVIYPIIDAQGRAPCYLGKVLLGTVTGDSHDIGKNIVGAVFTANGFEVIDLGVDVPVKVFVEKVKELEPDVLGMSALMSTTMQEQRKVIEALKEAGLRDKVKVLVGGAVVTSNWAEDIEADGYGEDAVDAIAEVKKILNID